MCDAQDVDKAVMILTNDNLELACQVVEKTASEKAIREVDERLQMAYQVGLPCLGRHPRHVQLLSDVMLWQLCNVLRVHQGKAGQGREGTFNMPSSIAVRRMAKVALSSVLWLDIVCL